MVNSLASHIFAKRISVLSTTRQCPSSDANLPENSARLSQPLNILWLTRSTFAPILMLFSALQPLNAELPMLSTLSGMVIALRLLQPLNALLPIDVTLS